MSDELEQRCNGVGHVQIIVEGVGILAFEVADPTPDHANGISGLLSRSRVARLSRPLLQEIATVLQPSYRGARSVETFERAVHRLTIVVRDQQVAYFSCARAL